MQCLTSPTSHLHFAQTMASLLVWIANILIVGCIASPNPTKIPEIHRDILKFVPLRMTHEQPLSFNELIHNILTTARESAINKKDIIKQYRHVSGPSNMNMVGISDLVIRYHHSTTMLDINKSNNGYTYLELAVNIGEQTGEIVDVNAMQNGMSATQLLIFANELLSRLKVKKSSIYDQSEYVYKGCDDKDETVILIDLYAILGGKMGYYEKFGYMSPNQDEIAILMQNIHDYKVPPAITCADGERMTFGENSKLGVILSYYWTNDKCVFSKLYHEFKQNAFFRLLHAQSRGPRFKIFDENQNTSPLNIIE